MKLLGTLVPVPLDILRSIDSCLFSTRPTHTSTAHHTFQQASGGALHLLDDDTL